MGDTMQPTLDSAIDVTSAVVRIIGDTAQVALQIGSAALPILQNVGVLLPPAGIAANYVAVALPYIAQIAKYAPAVSAGLSANKPMIEAAVGVGRALIEPLAMLGKAIPELQQTHVLFAEIAKRSEFTPTDPRFNRVDPAQF